MLILRGLVECGQSAAAISERPDPKDYLATTHVVVCAMKFHKTGHVWSIDEGLKIVHQLMTHVLQNDFIVPLMQLFTR